MYLVEVEHKTSAELVIDEKFKQSSRLVDKGEVANTGPRHVNIVK